MGKITFMQETGPQPRNETIRQALVRVMEGGWLSAGDLSRAVGQSEKDVGEHLEAIRRAGRLEVTPARCRQCEYVFRERARAKKPGKCPECKSTRIVPPLFSVRAE